MFQSQRLTDLCRACAACLVCAAPAFAQPVMRSFTIDCGGQVVTGGAIRLTATIAQHDATGHIAGGALDLATGFLVPVSSCEADFNQSGTVNSQDFFDFLTAFFNEAPNADIDHNGVINSQDYFDFLTAFFTGC